MSVNIDTLRVACDRLLTHVKETHGTELEIDEEQLYDVYKTPRSESLMLGQLSDDWEEIQQVQKLDDSESPISHQLRHLSSLLRYIGEQYIL